VRRVVLAAVVLLAAGAAFPPPALAHGLSSRADLPIPAWLFTWGAVAVLVVSFVALGVRWRAARLDDYEVWPLPDWVSRAVLGGAAEILCGTIGVFLLGLVIWAGLFGNQAVPENITPTFVYVAFWVALVPVSVLFGNVFAAFNPWRATGRAVAWLAAKTLGEKAGSGLPYPAWLGNWPAVAGLLAFVWLELLSPDGTSPRTIAAAALLYSSLTFLGMGLFGVEAWSRRAEAFSVYFGLFSRASVFDRDEDRVVLRPPLTGLTELRAEAGTVAVLATMIGTVSYDGLQETSFWADVAPPIEDFFRFAGASPTLSLELAGGVGLFACVAAVAGFFLLGILGARTVAGSFSIAGLARSFVHSLVPIALVYVGAHYLTFLLFQGQALGYLASDPAGRGWDLFGTANDGIDYGLIGATVTWYVQVAFVVVGHLSGLTLAHDRALTLYEDLREAVRSQYWMLAVMVGFTSFALWLLSQANA
jgi:hypothetical protein